MKKAKAMRIESKKAEAGMWWYIVAAILAIAFIVLGFLIITGSGNTLREFIDKIKEFF